MGIRAVGPAPANPSWRAALPQILASGPPVAGRLPHYGRWAAAIGLTVLFVVAIVTAITLVRSNRRGRR